MTVRLTPTDLRAIADYLEALQNTEQDRFIVTAPDTSGAITMPWWDHSLNVTRTPDGYVLPVDGAY